LGVGVRFGWYFFSDKNEETEIEKKCRLSFFLLFFVFLLMKQFIQMNIRLLLPVLLLCALSLNAQQNKTTHNISKVWVADKGDGTYQNPIIHADYSDPDAIRVGDDYYLVSSSFEDIPGLPILHSKDLVNWTIIGHALLRQPPFDHFSIPQHGNGVWAPALRYHKGEFYLYYPDPDFGIYLVKAKNPAGPWSEPMLVEAGKGLIDPCPFWEEDGKAYLVHAWAGSRAGIKSIITLKKLNAEGTKVLDNGIIVYDGHEKDPTIEGPKLYKRNGYYYIFAPAGGVATGWQVVLRSKNIYGPYERKVVMGQGKSTINGPHQGAWVTTQTGEDWFLHFQDKSLYGRMLHLQPMKWVSDWPVIGMDADGDGKGEPVLTYKKPNVGKQWPIQTPPDTDEFDSKELGMQWQCQANAKSTWYFMNPEKGSLRLYSDKLPDSAKNLWDAPNVLLQKFPAETFMATAKLNFTPNGKIENEKAGLVIMGFSYANLAIKNSANANYLVYTVCRDAVKGKPETEKIIQKINTGSVYLRVKVIAGGKCIFSYSMDGNEFVTIDETFQAESGRWIGAKMGLFCTRISQTNDSGFVDVDWFRVETID
jgi:beta-xylosidase